MPLVKIKKKIEIIYANLIRTYLIINSPRALITTLSDNTPTTKINQGA